MSTSSAGLVPAQRAAAFAPFGVAIYAGALIGHGAAILRKMPTVDFEAVALMTGALQAAHASPDDRLLVLNGTPWLNIATDLRPPTAVYHLGHLECDFPGAGVPALQAAFAARPRFLMLENPNLRLFCERPATADAIAAGLEADYDAIDSGGTKETRFRLYALRR